MAKKFSKFLLFTAAVSAAGAAAYYITQKKTSALPGEEGDEDYDDFGAAEETETASRTYVPLNHETPSEQEAEADSADQDDFTPLSEQAPQASETLKDKAEETVEEFFDETE